MRFLRCCTLLQIGAGGGGGGGGGGREGFVVQTAIKDWEVGGRGWWGGVHANTTEASASIVYEQGSRSETPPPSNPHEDSKYGHVSPCTPHKRPGAGEGGVTDMTWK